MVGEETCTFIFLKIMLKKLKLLHPYLHLSVEYQTAPYNFASYVAITSKEDLAKAHGNFVGIYRLHVTSLLRHC